MISFCVLTLPRHWTRHIHLAAVIQKQHLHAIPGIQNLIVLEIKHMTVNDAIVLHFFSQPVHYGQEAAFDE
jgi:hypothetical protein